ncbi:binding-protein-dependent transport systems inner membrane component [Thermobaculum terrenum ATCC BAA-798]|uniref:Binding-protein-dependent transport systems inner membrane component n=1 Tax=Thermobaculum terrenum (strain ATCC BAA-798 / CCMEE 7001 / YNP1) TaxID=525904 RepID=D1CI41_THET1|nr:sugar ABC transporter permease [Thermobaculum terrenum]ACZ43412.1 binding-protein-dependent transport systems inner membrane component [Thermobaculum terrenum ATCC BAA-798]
MARIGRASSGSRRISLRLREAVEGYLFMAPAVLGFLLFTLFPMLASFALSFTDYDLLSPPRWVGLANYLQMVRDPFFWQSLKVTTIYAAAGLPLGLTLALAVAILMNQKVPALALWRTVYLLPSVISGVAVAILWRWLFNPEFGLLNVLLGYLGIKGPDWLGSTTWALPSLIIMGLWGIGGSMLIYLSGLQGIPTELYEAAEIDGAGRLAKLWYVTIPMISPVILFNLVIGLIGAFQYFTEAYVLTGGGPENSTLFYMLYLYRNAFNYFKMGYASALAWTLFMLVLLLTIAVFRTTPMWVYYEGERRGR